MKVLIVEDEPAAAQRMRRLLAEVEPEAVVLRVVETVREAVEWFANNEAPDLAFFDVQLADGESFAVFERASVECPVVFTTAYDAHALQAFRVNAVDYLLKPIKAEELREAIARVQRLGLVRDHTALSTSAAHDGGEGPRAFIKRFLIRYGDHFRVVVPDDIAYIHSMEKNTFLRTREGRDLPLDESLDRLEKQLDPEMFHRINRQVITHIRSIKELLAYSKSRVKVILDPAYGQDAVVSSERSAGFKRWLSGQ
ncbi:MAG: response regulator transcription factor [Flavobacteriales bacterium]|nr:response regulator transcription factor [Flavobacteriales bacterium]